MNSKGKTQGSGNYDGDNDAVRAFIWQRLEGLCMPRAVDESVCSRRLRFFLMFVVEDVILAVS